MEEKQFTHQKWQEAITSEKIDVDGKSRWRRDEYNKSMDRLYMDEYDERGERKVIKFS
jgi:hypothetical protein